MAGRLPNREPRQHTRHSILPWLGWLYLTLLVLAVWQLAHQQLPHLIPGPRETLKAAEDFGGKTILRGVRVTLTNSLLGYTIALILALTSVVLSYVNSHFKAFFNALNTFIQSVSVLVWAIVLVMVFGVTSRKPPILVVTAATYPILLSNLLAAVRAVDDQYMILARSLGATKLQELTYFILPGIVPYLAGASRAAIGIALRISVVAEAFGASGGVGYWLVYSYDYGYREGVFAWAWILIILMIALDLLILKPIERWSTKWKLEK
ncbi:MAG: ABC transporter permease subunit [Desulfurococcales archaeon]|nr:ABC transporter permease subunit [Desulfurococcales archaeon]